MKQTTLTVVLLVLVCAGSISAEEPVLDVSELMRQIETGEAYEQYRQKYPVIQRADKRINKGERCNTRYFNCIERETFWSSTNVLMGIGLYGTAVADLETTYRLIAHPPVTSGDIEYSGAEGNPLMAPFVHHGRPVGYAIKMGINTGIWVATHKMRRSDNKVNRVFGWVMPIVIMAGQGYLTKHNHDTYRSLVSLQ